MLGGSGSRGGLGFSPAPLGSHARHFSPLSGLSRGCPQPCLCLEVRPVGAWAPPASARRLSVFVCAFRMKGWVLAGGPCSLWARVAYVCGSFLVQKSRVVLLASQGG